MAENRINLNSAVIGSMMHVNGHELHYVQTEEGENPVLLIHGIGFSLYSMRNVYNSLSEKGYKVYAIDLPGSGYSIAGRRKRLTPDHMAETFHKFLEELKLSKINIYAIGEGAIYALRLSQLYPGDVETMVLASPGSLTKHYPAKYRHLIQPIVGEVMVKLMDRKHINLFLRWILFDETGVTAPLARQVYQPFTQKEAKLGLLSLLRDYQDIQVFSNMSKVFCPVKIIWGDYDSGHPINMSTLFLKRIENCSMSVINNSGHLVHEERPKMVSDIVDRFISYNT